MKNLFFKATQKQKQALEGLAYWIADVNYIKERFGSDDPELKKCDDTIQLCIFPELDALHVPFWVQNIVISWAENWRQYKEYYFSDAMKKYNIIL